MNGKVETTPKRDWRLDRALLACSAAPSLSGAELEVLVGHMTVRALLHRGLMSILRHSYVFIRANYTRRTRLWNSVVLELELFRNLMVLGQADIFAEWDASPLITDACTTGYGVCEGRWGVKEVEAVGREDERWRYHRGPPDRSNPRAAALDESGVFDDPDSVLPYFAGERPFELVENPLFPEVPKSLLSCERWRTLWCAPFAYKDTIHVLEARGVLGAVKHRSRDHHKHGSRILILNDNLGVVLAISKGRCADFGLLRIIRRIAAHSLATGIRFVVRWVPSELNIADGPSRMWEPQHGQIRGSKEQPKKSCEGFHEAGGCQSQWEVEESPSEGSFARGTTIEEPIIVHGEDHTPATIGRADEAAQLRQAQAGEGKEASEEVRAAFEGELGRKDNPGVTQRARGDPQELRAEARKVLRVCPFLPVEHQDASRARRSALRLRRPPVPVWRKLQQWSQASGRVGTPPARGDTRRAAAPPEVQESNERVEEVSPDAIAPSYDRVREERNLGCAAGDRAEGDGPFQRTELLDVREAGGAPEVEGRRLRGEELRLWPLSRGACSGGKGRDHQSWDLRRDSHPRRPEGAVDGPTGQEAFGRPNQAAWRGCGHVGLQGGRLPAGLEVSRGGPGGGGHRKVPVSEPPRGCQPRSSPEAQVDSIDSAQGQVGLRLECKDLRQARAAAAEHQQTRRPTSKVWGGCSPELSPLVPEWHVPTSDSSEEEDGRPLKGKYFLSLFGGQAEGARYVADNGGHAAVVDLAYSPQNDLAKPSRWNVILSRVHHFHAVGIDLPCNTWSRARRAKPSSKFPSPLRGDDDVSILGLPDLSVRDKRKVADGNNMFFGSLKLIRKCLKLGIPGYLENPLNSRIWKTRGMKRLLRDGRVRIVPLDQCQYGTAWKKPTRLLVWLCPCFCMLRCSGAHGCCSRTRRPHIQLSGVRGKRFMTEQAQVYTPDLARAILQQICR